MCNTYSSVIKYYILNTWVQLKTYSHMSGMSNCSRTVAAASELILIWHACQRILKKMLNLLVAIFIQDATWTPHIIDNEHKLIGQVHAIEMNRWYEGTLQQSRYRDRFILSGIQKWSADSVFFIIGHRIIATSRLIPIALHLYPVYFLLNRTKFK